jgi:hypothetical protein
MINGPFINDRILRDISLSWIESMTFERQKNNAATAIPVMAKKKDAKAIA